MSAISHKAVWRIALPMILSNILVPLVGAIDTAVVGHLDTVEYIGAVAIGSIIFSFLYWGFGFLRMGTTGFIARAHGKDDHKEIIIICQRSLLIAVALAILVILSAPWSIPFALYWFDTSLLVKQSATIYTSIRIFSAPATLALYVITGVLIGLQNTRHAALLQILIAFTNIVLNVIFVFAFGWGLEGVAYATLIAEYLGLALGLYLLQPIGLFSWSIKWPQLFDTLAIRELMATNINLFIRTLCLIFSMALFTAQSAKLGIIALAANTVLMHLQSISAFTLDAFAFAAEGLAGKAYGARDQAAYKRAVKLSSLWSFLLALLIACIYYFFAGTIILWFTSDITVQHYFNQYIFWLALLPLLSVASYQLDAIFIATGFTSAMRNTMILSTGLYIICLYLFLPLWQNHGLLLAFSCFMIFRALTLAYCYRNITASFSNA